ncbi:MAG TPA: hypothetical protein VK886_19655 [Vicinamibacterales bacterium]|nr:hypothetical protein [Vicinamibacterales bacterium]
MTAAVDGEHGPLALAFDGGAGQGNQLALPWAVGFRMADTGERATHGPLINLLTASDECDPLTKTPYHKNVPVRVRKAAAAIA